MKFSNTYAALVLLGCLFVTIPSAQGMKRQRDDSGQKDQQKQNLFSLLPSEIHLLIADFVVNPNKQMAVFGQDDDGKMIVVADGKNAPTRPEILAINDDVIAQNLYKFLMVALENKKVQQTSCESLGLDNKFTLNGKDILYYAIATNDKNNLLRILKEQDIQNTLKAAITQKNILIIRFLLAYCKDFFENDSNAKSVILSAIETKNTIIVRDILNTIIENNKSLFRCKNNTLEILLTAFQGNNLEIEVVENLLQVINQQDSNFFKHEIHASKLVLAACETGNIDLCTMLLDVLKKVGNLSKDILGLGLCKSIQKQLPNLLELLLKYGACPSKGYSLKSFLYTQANNQALTPLTFCVFLYAGNPTSLLQTTLQCIELLIGYGADRDVLSLICNDNTDFSSQLHGQKLSACDLAMYYYKNDNIDFDEILQRLKNYKLQSKQNCSAPSKKSSEQDCITQ